MSGDTTRQEEMEGGPLGTNPCGVHQAEVVSLKGDSYRLKNRDLGRVPSRHGRLRMDQELVKFQLPAVSAGHRKIGLPKKTELSQHVADHVQAVVNQLNGRPRRTLRCQNS